jgi:chemotaxis protein CheD
MPTSNHLIDVFLQPGDWFVADEDYQLRTILGSCVSITLWHPPSRIGGMSHFLLPNRPKRGQVQVQAQDLDARYGDEAVQLILAQLAIAGVAGAECEAKIFGGGNMFPSYIRGDAINVGQRNGDAARQMLRHLNIPVVSECLFGVGHRQVIFDVSRGDVWSCQIEPSQA